MTKKRGLLLLLFCCVFIELVSANCVNLSDSSTFGSTVSNTSNNIYINGNVTLCAARYDFINKSGLNINSSNIILDCNNSIINGTDHSSTYGVNITGFGNVTIKNCQISDFDLGVYLAVNSTDCTIENNTLYSNAESDIYLDSNSSNIKIINNIISSLDATLISIVLDETRYSNISNNLLGAAFFGIYVNLGYNNTIQNNTFNHSIYNMVLFESYNNTISYNDMFSSGYSFGSYSALLGMYLISSSNNEVHNNNLRYDIRGIYLEGSNYNTIYNNTLTENDYGLYLSSSENNTVFNNTANLNRESDIYLSSDAVFNSGDNNCSILTDETNLGTLTCDIHPEFVQGLCGQGISENTVLTQNITNCSSNGLLIGRNNVVLDCAGYTISGNNTGRGVYNNGFDNVTIRNCTLHYFNTGAYSRYSANSTIENVFLNRNYYGIYLYYNSNTGLYNNTASYNSYGTYISSNNNITNILNNTFCSNMFTDLFLSSSSLNNSGDNTCIILEDETNNNTVTCNTTCGFNQGSCGQAIINSTVLTTDILNCQMNGINVYGDNIVLDCNNSRITGASGAEIGIGSFESNNITIKNCLVENYSVGAYLDTTDNSTFSDTNINSNGWEYGVELYYSNSNILNNITANASYLGIELYESRLNNITNNTLYSESGYGIVASENANSNILRNNNVYLTGGLYCEADSGVCPGILISYSDYNLVDSNNINVISGYGISVGEDNYDSLAYNNITNNIVNVTNGDGIVLYGASSTKISNNIVYSTLSENCNSSPCTGIAQIESLTSTVDNNTVTTNQGNTFYSLNSGYSTVTNNTFTSQNSSALRIDSDSEYNVFLENIIVSDRWVNDSSVSSSYNNSRLGNKYYYLNNTASWMIYNISDATNDTWADFGSDLPFNSSLPRTEWAGLGQDYHPFTNKTDLDMDGRLDNNDTLLYNESNVTLSGISNLNITISGNTTQGTYSGVQEVVFYNSTTRIMNFSFNFSAGTLDLSKVTIIKDTYSLIVNISNTLYSNKTLFIEDKDFMALCVKDDYVTSISEVSSNCNGANETDLTSCINSSVTKNGIRCVDEGETFKIENLAHSAVKGTPIPIVAPSSSGTGGGGCTTKWICTEWSMCSQGVKYRNCTREKQFCSIDLNTKPVENQSCETNSVSVTTEAKETINKTEMSYSEDVILTAETQSPKETTEKTKTGPYALDTSKSFRTLAMFAVMCLVVFFIVKSKRDKEERRRK